MNFKFNEKIFYINLINIKYIYIFYFIIYLLKFYSLLFFFINIFNFTGWMGIRKKFKYR